MNLRNKLKKIEIKKKKMEVAMELTADRVNKAVPRPGPC